MTVDTFPLVEELAIARFVGPLNLSRGRSVERAGAVAELEWDTVTFRLSAAVQGTAARPYRSTVSLDLGIPDRTTILAGICTCPVGRNCKHLAAVLLAAAERHRHERAEAAEARASGHGDAPAVAGWRAEIAALAGGGSGDEWDAASPRLPLALQFELRERIARRAGRRQGARDETASSAASVDRLAVRPVTRGARGGWIKGTLTWQNVGFQGRAGGFDPAQARWFGEFSLLKGSRHAAFAEFGSAWISLDEYESRTLWSLLASASALGIQLVGTTSTTAVTVGAAAEIRLDARLGDGPTGGDLLLAPSVSIDGEPHATDHVRLIGDHGVYAYDFARGTITLAPLAGALTAAGRAAVRRESPVVVPADEVAEFVAQQYPTLARSLRVLSADESFALPRAPAGDARRHHPPRAEPRPAARVGLGGRRRTAVPARRARQRVPRADRRTSRRHRRGGTARRRSGGRAGPPRRRHAAAPTERGDARPRGRRVRGTRAAAAAGDRAAEGRRGGHDARLPRTRRDAEAQRDDRRERPHRLVRPRRDRHGRGHAGAVRAALLGARAGAVEAPARRRQLPLAEATGLRTAARAHRRGGLPSTSGKPGSASAGTRRASGRSSRTSPTRPNRRAPGGRPSPDFATRAASNRCLPPTASPSSCGRTSSTGSAGSRSSTSTGSAASSPTTWGSARRRRRSRSSRRRSSDRMPRSIRSSSSLRPRSSRTGWPRPRDSCPASGSRPSRRRGPRAGDGSRMPRRAPT